MELPIPAQQLGHRCLGLGDLGRLNLEEHLGARQMIGVVGDEKVALSLVQSSPKHCVLFWTKNVLSHLVFCLRCLWICCHCLSKCLLNVVIVLAVRSIYPPSAIRALSAVGDEGRGRAPGPVRLPGREGGADEGSGAAGPVCAPWPPPPACALRPPASHATPTSARRAPATNHNPVAEGPS